MGRSIVDKIRDKIISFRKGAIIVNTKIGRKVFISKNVFSSNSELGDFTSIGRNSTIVHSVLGRYCSISWNVTIGATQHPISRLTTHAFSYIAHFGFVSENKRFKSLTKVGNDVWIGANAIVLPNLSIGNGVIIGAGSVVTKDVPDFAIVAGVPAKIIRFRFSEAIIDRINKTNWWNIEPQTIKENIEIWKDDLNDEILSRLEEVCA